MTPSIETTVKNQKDVVNGIDVAALKRTAADIAADPAEGKTSWRVSTSWKGGTRSDTRVTSYAVGKAVVQKDFTISVDEPLELCGTNQFPNPQEYLLAALNACMMVGYTAAFALEGVTLRELRIDSGGDIDLRGFLGIDPAVKPGYDRIQYTVFVKSDATPVQLERIHDTVCRTSPNRFNLSQPIRLDARLVAE
jgi:uncharacterized OsmC-like protein